MRGLVQQGLFGQVEQLAAELVQQTVDMDDVDPTAGSSILFGREQTMQTPAELFGQSLAAAREQDAPATVSAREPGRVMDGDDGLARPGDPSDQTRPFVVGLDRCALLGMEEQLPRLPLHGKEPLELDLQGDLVKRAPGIRSPERIEAELALHGERGRLAVGQIHEPFPDRIR